MGLFGKKENLFDEIKYAHEHINIPRHEDIQYFPLGQDKKRTIESNDINKNILHVTKDEEDIDYLIATILQIIKREESLIILDPDGILYNKFKMLLFSKNYKIRYIDIDDEDSNTWNFFDNEKLDTKNEKAIEEVLYKCRVLIEIFMHEFLDKEEQEKYLDNWTVIFAAIYSYISTNYILVENKFQRMYDLIEYQTLSELDDLFEYANDITYELWFNTIDISNEEKDYLLSLSLGLIDIIRESDTNRLISNSDMDLVSPAKRKSAFFFNSIPDALDDNNCINIILNCMLLELEEHCLEVGRCKVPVNFIINNLDSFPNFSYFIENSTLFRNHNVSFIYTCCELDSIYDSYDSFILNKFFNNLNYVTISEFDQENFMILNEYVIELPVGITSDMLEDKQILVAQDRVLLTQKYDYTNHPIYYRICYD